MVRVVLVSCVSRKRDKPAPAKDLYTSDLFRKAYAYAEDLKPDFIYILSAEHGLVEPHTVLAPYNKALTKMRQEARAAWSERVLADLRKRHDLARDEFIFLAGEKYRAGLAPHMAHASAPLKGLGIGRQLAWYKQALR